VAHDLLAACALIVGGAYGLDGGDQTGGHRAFVRMSRAVPVPSSAPVSSAGGTVLASGKTYLDGDLAFSVVPRLADDQVTLEITATNNTVGNRGALDVQRAQNTVSGRLGERLNVGRRSARRAHPLAVVGERRSLEPRPPSTLTRGGTVVSFQPQVPCLPGTPFDRRNR
jgi:hypothetical protein